MPDAVRMQHIVDYGTRSEETLKTTEEINWPLIVMAATEGAPDQPKRTSGRLHRRLRDSWYEADRPKQSA